MLFQFFSIGAVTGLFSLPLSLIAQSRRSMSADPPERSQELKSQLDECGRLLPPASQLPRQELNGLCRRVIHPPIRQVKAAAATIGTCSKVVSKSARNKLTNLSEFMSVANAAWRFDESVFTTNGTISLVRNPLVGSAHSP